ncbi:hypothetical protein PENTCL1PPCAC_13812 [Pristionchus entomophagus]|uniref:G protein-coupled receptor n=1 Tax=Pristionchus entomophagus TaxID=358040 RepID=A0AAV5TBC8_9BILA|nr:hypothetical protein PENTCL1PPCAC_13812 [Pristionchus entomophagus]
MHPIIFFAIAIPFSTIVVTFLTVIFVLGLDIVLNNRNQLHVFVRSLVGWKWIAATSTFLMNKLMEVLKTCGDATTGISHCSILHHLIGAIMIVGALFTISASFVTYLGLIEPTAAGRHRHPIPHI